MTDQGYGALLGGGRSTIYGLIGERRLETVKIARRTRIKTAPMRRLVETEEKV